MTNELNTSCTFRSTLDSFFSWLFNEDSASILEYILESHDPEQELRKLEKHFKIRIKDGRCLNTEDIEFLLDACKNNNEIEFHEQEIYNGDLSLDDTDDVIYTRSVVIKFILGRKTFTVHSLLSYYSEEYIER